MGAAGACVNRLHSRQPPLAQPALSPYWRALAAADRMLALTRISGRSLPPRVSSSIFTVINQGSYARGYRRAWRAGSPADERAGKRLGGSAGT
jgi:hypothetical protein